MYQQDIQNALNEKGRTDVDARYVECIMRLEHGTLDTLSQRKFQAEIALGIKCWDEDTNDGRTGLIDSYGY